MCADGGGEGRWGRGGGGVGRSGGNEEDVGDLKT